MRRKLLIILGLFALFIVVFVLAFFWAFPTESIKHLAEKSIEKQLKQEQSVEIGELSISPLLNVTLKNFSMKPRNTVSDSGIFATKGGVFNGFWCAPYVEDQPFIIDEVFVNPSIFKIAKKKPAGKFELKMQDGKIEGEFKSAGNVISVDAVGTEISLNEFALFSNFTKTQIYGMLKFDLRASLENSKMSEMQLDLNVENTALCPKRFKTNNTTMPFIEMPFTVFGMVFGNVEIQKDKLRIHKLQSTGPDIKLDVTGDVTMKSNKNQTMRLNIEADISPSEQWIEDNNMASIYKMCEKHEDGSIHLTITGTSAKPKIDCGTPIPEPIEPVQVIPKNDNKEAKQKADKKEKAEAEEPKKEEKKTDELPIQAEQRDVTPEGVARRDPAMRRVDSGQGDSRVRIPNRPNLPRGTRGERPAGGRGERPVGGRADRGMNPDIQLRNTEALDENIAREMNRRNRRRNNNDE